MTRIPGCIWTPAKFDPQYPLGKAFPRSLDEIEFTVNHDARGYRNYLKNGNGLGKQNSWLLTNLLDGTRHQHYELEAGTWTSSSYWANTRGVATEHESQIGDLSLPITWAQAEADLETEAFLKTVCPNLKPPILGQGRREHNEFSTSTCPNGRIQPLYDAEEEEDDMLLFIGRQGEGGGIFSLDGQYINGKRWAAIQDAAKKEGIKVVVNKRPSTDDFFNDVMTFPAGDF